MPFICQSVFQYMLENIMTFLLHLLQVRETSQCCLSIISKAAPILADDTFTDMMPVAWELLLETDQELAAAAGRGAMFLSSCSYWPCSCCLHHAAVTLSRILPLISFLATCSIR